jgi:SAM-dependent methyltransferase
MVGSDDPITRTVEMRGLQSVVDEFVADKGQVRVLEAGCGSLTYIDLGSEAYVVGLDVSDVALERNTSLDERILGDVEEHEFPVASFDVIVCWYVFEHLPHPDRALARFAHALRPGGLLILALPNVLSIKGLVTKFTPFRFHVWVRRRLLGRPLAGTPGHAPYPTYLPFSIAPSALRTSAARLGLSQRYAAMVEDPKQIAIRTKFRLTGRTWDLVKRAIRFLGAGKLASDETEYVVVFRSAPALSEPAETAGSPPGAVERSRQLTDGGSGPQ